MNDKNLNLQFFKFVYAWVIVGYHLTGNTALTVIGGYYSVEFYLLAAGFFLFSSFFKQAEQGTVQTPYQYLKKRFLRLFPWSFTAFLFGAVISRGIIDPVHSPGELMDQFSGDIWEILLVKWSGLNEGFDLVNGPAWTLSSMCIAGFLIWACLYLDRRRFLNLFMPLSLLLGFGLWRHLDFADTGYWIGFTTFGTFRAWLIMCLSCYTLWLTRRLSKTQFNTAGKVILTAIELGIHVFAILVMLRRATRYYQWLVTMLFMIEIAIAMSGHSYLSKFLAGKRFAAFLGELSMSVFLIHAPLIKLFGWRYDISDWSYPQLIPFFAAVLAAALCHYLLTNALIRLFPRCWTRISGLLVDS